MPKQVQAALAPQPGATPQPRNLYVTVNTYNPEGKQIGTRVVDMHHYGTRNWLQDHTWWAMHNGNTVEIMIANEAEIADYVANVANKVEQKFAKAS